jgi:hypothetical protein
MNKPMTSLFSPFQQVFDNFWNMPVTSWQRFFNPQFVFNYNPDDEGVEYHVLQRVGSYGSQLSTLIEMMCLLRRTALDEAKLDPAQKLVVAEFDRLHAESKRAVAEYRGENQSVDVDQALALLQALKQKDPTAYAALKTKLAALGD